MSNHTLHVDTSRASVAAAVADYHRRVADGEPNQYEDRSEKYGDCITQCAGQSTPVRASGCYGQVFGAYHLPRRANTVVPHVADHIEVGAILYSSWGYDQTNIDFYVVVRTTKASAWIVPLSSTVEETTGFLSERVTAGDKFDHEAKGECHRIRRYSDRESLHLTSYSSAWLWDGASKHASHYA